MKKKYLALGLCVVLSLSACGGQKATQEPAQEPDQKVVQQTEPAPQLVEVKAETPVRPEDTAGENKVDEAAPVEEVTPVEEVKTVDPFTETEETVYATGSVNIRASWSAESEKLGALNTGDSLTRIGIGTGEAENWSRVTLTDGSTAYISSKYLSTSKPVPAQQATGGGTATGGSGGSSKTTQQGTTEDGLALDGWEQLPNGMWRKSSSTPSESSAPAASQPNRETTNRVMTDEEQNAASETARKIYAGEEQLKFDEEGGYYYYE